MSEQWGPGEKISAPFGTTVVGTETVELVHGEHPHSRSDSNIYAKFPNGRIEGFAGHRILWSTHITEYNYLKQSGLSGDEVREGCNIIIFMNNIQIYEEFHRNISAALLQVRRVIEEFEALPVSIWTEKDRADIIGRKVYWRHSPAFVKSLTLDRGCVTLVPDVGFISKFPKPPWRNEESDDTDDDQVFTEILDKNIWWFRD